MIYKLSPSDLTYLYDGCKFCFWLKVKHGIPQPSMPMPGIFSAIAGRQKDFYSDKRTEEFCKELPPGVVHLGEKWVQSIPIAGKGIDARCYIKGRFDAVVKFDDGSYGVIDFKTASPSDEKAEMYGRQLQAYTFALENPDEGQLKLTPITKLGLLFFEPSGYSQIDISAHSFNGRVVWIEVKRDDEKFSKFIQEALKLLAEESPPSPDSDCGWCRYRDTMTSLNLNVRANVSSQDNKSPLCPKCGSNMRLRKGKNGEFWGCTQYPNCRGTRDSGEFRGEFRGHDT